MNKVKSNDSFNFSKIYELLTICKKSLKNFQKTAEILFTLDLEPIVKLDLKVISID